MIQTDSTILVALQRSQIVFVKNLVISKNGNTQPFPKNTVHLGDTAVIKLYYSLYKRDIYIYLFCRKINAVNICFVLTV